MAGQVKAQDNIVSVAVRVKPGSAKPRVGGLYVGAYGAAIVVAVAASAVDGAATEAARRALAAALGLRNSAVTLCRGAKSRDKLFSVVAPAGDVQANVRQLQTDEAGAR